MVVYPVVCLVSAFVGGIVGHRKGSSYIVWFLISLVIPVLGPIAALLYRHETDVALRLCPDCGRVLRLHDAMCMRCGCELDFPEESEIIRPDPSIRVRAGL
jgi:hypothetical protein